MERKSKFLRALLLLLIIGIFMGKTTAASADDVTPGSSASKVSIGAVDYESLLLRVYPNGNSIVYLSADKGKTWTEAEGKKAADTEGKEYIEIDISWASPTSNVKLIFKGNEVDEEAECILPKQVSTFTVKFDKATGELVMTKDTEATEFWWRKASDYEWKSVPFNTQSDDYKKFASMVESLRYKGAKLVFRTAQTPGTNADNMGSRPSKEVKVSIPKYASAPSIKLNLTKLILNTKATMEFTTDFSSENWTKCEKNMSLEEVAPDVFAGDGKTAADVTLYFRVAQTEKKTASRACCITFPAQTQGPSAGESGTDIACSENSTSGKYEFKFLTASATQPIEYCIVTPGGSFELTKAKWKSVKNSKTVALKEKAIPDGTMVYFRFKGMAENVKKGIEFALPSACTTYTVTWRSGSGE
ncbi:MAG: hypothetical protein K6E85_17310 [Lachnospiraceae bacterium]|nr:hypothetical protein [Lachnospiraceae bacterium]